MGEKVTYIHQFLRRADAFDEAIAADKAVIGAVSQALDPSFTDHHAPNMEQRVTRLEDDVRGIGVGLTDIKATMATREDIREAMNVSRTWGMWSVGTIIATGLGLASLIIAMNGLFMQASGNQLSAFQAGLATIQAVAAAKDMSPSAPQPPSPTEKLSKP